MLEIRHEHMNDLNQLQKAYDGIFEEKKIRHPDSFYLWLIGLLDPQPERTLLDISCGQGRLVVLAEERGLRAMGLDFAMEGVSIGKNEGPGAGWLVGDGETIPIADSSIDYIMHIGSLEHYLSPEKGASEIARILKPDGKACILLPNAFGLWGNIKNVALHGEIFDDGQPLQRYATRNTWEQLLRKAGLRISLTTGYGEIVRPRTNNDWIWLIKHPQKIVRGFINSLMPINLINHFVFIAQRDPTN